MNQIGPVLVHSIVGELKRSCTSPQYIRWAKYDVNHVQDLTMNGILSHGDNTEVHGQVHISFLFWLFCQGAVSEINACVIGTLFPQQTHLREIIGHLLWWLSCRSRSSDIIDDIDSHTTHSLIQMHPRAVRDLFSNVFLRGICSCTQRYSLLWSCGF